MYRWNSTLINSWKFFFICSLLWPTAKKQDVNEWYDDDGRRDRKIRCDFLAFFPVGIFYGSCWYILYRNDVKRDWCKWLIIKQVTQKPSQVFGRGSHVQLLWTSYMYYECITSFTSRKSKASGTLRDAVEITYTRHNGFGHLLISLPINIHYVIPLVKAEAA